MANPSPPSVGAVALADMSALVVDYGSVSAYADGGGAEASLAAGVLQAESDIGDLETDAATAAYEFGGNLQVGLRLSTGAAVPEFADGSADGYALDDSEAVVLRINDDSTTIFVQSVKIPDDVDDTAAITLHVRGYRTGTADTSAVLTIGAFAHETGDVHTDDADAGGDTTTFSEAVADTISDETLAFAAGVLPAGSNVSLTIVVKDTTLADDDLCLLDAWFVGTRVPHAA